MSDVTFTVLKIPLSVIETWPKPNYVNPVQRTWAIPLSIVLTAITTVIILARIFARVTRRAGKFGIDDALIILAWSFTLAYTIVMILLITHKAVGLHEWDVMPTKARWGGKLGFTSGLLLIWSSMATKVSILLFYRRIVGATYSGTPQRLIHVALAYTILSLIALSVAHINTCTPVSAYWNGFDISYDAPHRCRSFATFDMAACFVMLSSDVLTLVVPFIVVSKLSLPYIQKTMLAAIFGCGIIALAAGSLRVYYSWNLFHGTWDAAWASFDLFVWVEIELQLAMMCASVPALKGFLSNSMRARNGTLHHGYDPRKVSTPSVLPSSVRSMLPSKSATTGALQLEPEAIMAKNNIKGWIEIENEAGWELSEK